MAKSKSIAVETSNLAPAVTSAKTCAIVNLRDNPNRANVSVINEAIENALAKGTEFILLVGNVDRLIDPSEIKTLSAEIQNDLSIAAVAAAVKGWHSFGSPAATKTEMPFFGFHTVLIRVSALFDIGNKIDPTFNLFWGADVDLGAQFRSKNYKIVLCKSVQVAESEKGAVYSTSAADTQMRQILTDKYGLGDTDKANEALKNGFDFDFSPFLKKK